MSTIDLGPAAAPTPTSVWPDNLSLRITLVGWAVATVASLLAVLVGMTLVFGPAAAILRVAGVAIGARCSTCLVLWAASPTARERMTHLG